MVCVNEDAAYEWWVRPIKYQNCGIEEPWKGKDWCWTIIELGNLCKANNCWDNCNTICKFNCLNFRKTRRLFIYRRTRRNIFSI